MAKSVKKKQEPRLEWKNDDIIPIMGYELEAFSNLVAIMTSDESDFHKFSYLYEMTKILPPMWERLKKEGHIKEVN